MRRGRYGRGHRASHDGVRAGPRTCFKRCGSGRGFLPRWLRHDGFAALQRARVAAAQIRSSRPEWARGLGLPRSSGRLTAHAGVVMGEREPARADFLRFRGPGGCTEGVRDPVPRAHDCWRRRMARGREACAREGRSEPVRSLGDPVELADGGLEVGPDAEDEIEVLSHCGIFRAWACSTTSSNLLRRR